MQFFLCESNYICINQFAGVPYLLKHTRVPNANMSQLKQGYKMYAFHVRTEPMICLELANVLVLQEKLENSNCFSGRHADSPWIPRQWGADLVGELTNLEILGPY